MEQKRVMTGVGVQALALEVLQDFFEDSLAGPLARKIAVLFTQRGERTQGNAGAEADEIFKQLGGFHRTYSAHLETGKGERADDPDGAFPDEEPGDGTGAFPDEEYPDEAPVLRPSQMLTIGDVLTRLKSGTPGYIKQRLDTGEYRMYDDTGTYLGQVDIDTMEQLTKRRVIESKHPSGSPDALYVAT